MVMYRCETWTLHKMQQNKLLVFSPCIDRNTGEWRIRHNVEILYPIDLCQKSNIIDIRGDSFGLTTHGENKEPLYTRYCVALQKSVRSLGRARLRLEDQVSRDVERVKPDTDWRVLAENRERWHGIRLSDWS